MTGYRVVLQVFDEAGAHERQQAERRFCQALEAARRETLFRAGEVERLELELSKACTAQALAQEGAGRAARVIEAALGVVAGALLECEGARARLRAERLPVLLQKVEFSGLGVALPQARSGVGLKQACREL